MARHSFIQMSKLPNVKGRISYITSHARQENLYATYRTADNEFWSNLARESQQEFKRSGTEGKCIEARELIIALPEVYTKYEPQEVLEDFTEEFHRRYGVECVSALHHNKRKTNYHIHLIFSERKLLPEPDIKIATRSVFYDETGKRVRTKKEITGEDGQIRKGCTVIKKGEVYESHLFTVKDDKFKSEPFLREVKEIYTDLINRHISDPEQQLKVFDKNSVYLPTKKIGKNNPKAAEIEADNAARQEWNRTADMALLSGIEETKILEIKKEEREAFIESIKKRIADRFKDVEFSAPPQIDGRVKSIYGIYKKIFVNHKSIEEVYDKYAVRIIVNTVGECYNVLGLIHDMFRPIPNRFKDYISTPKANMYQSLHTTVLGREGIPFEVQIRTWEMHATAEYGIAAHWKYKAGITAASSDRLDERLAWVRQLLESQRSSIDATDLLSDIKSDLLPEEVFAFTPRGDVINLPAGATVIDFAYAIHSAVGNRMIGAKVNNRIVPIDHQVVTGEIIEIITGPENRGPSRDWLNIVKTSEAKNKIRNWFKKERRDENIAEGKDAFEKELRRNLMVIPPEQYDEFMSNLARRNHCNSVDEMYAAIGYGGLQLARILPKLKEEYPRLKATEPKPLPTVDIKRVHSSDGVVVEGIDNCPIKFAKCCSPLPGDDIIGFVTRGFGVSIHKRDCANVQQSMKDPENAARWVKSYWADDAKEDYKATLELDCMDRANLLSDVALALGDMRVPIYSLSARAADQGRARMSLTVGIMNTVHLNNVVARLKKVKDVLTVTRN